jgi:hypothetical protein
LVKRAEKNQEVWLEGEGTVSGMQGWKTYVLLVFLTLPDYQYHIVSRKSPLRTLHDGELLVTWLKQQGAQG